MKLSLHYNSLIYSLVTYLNLALLIYTNRHNKTDDNLNSKWLDRTYNYNEMSNSLLDPPVYAEVRDSTVIFI